MRQPCTTSFTNSTAHTTKIVPLGGPFSRLPAHKHLETRAAGEGGQGQGGGEDGPFLGHAGKSHENVKLLQMRMHHVATDAFFLSLV